ncbi:hypothetical protein EVAR_27649_1 [Eumeta japonica]|uniref:Uncharacterized protein n=1 Tax=Eumeta variegata TaxID=151549 RepID=A0A4C1V1U6_EUMVA|nr:hypothetical protein EVAR_27649_1 [Eumeta japonica]
MDRVFFQTSLFSRASQCDGWLATVSDALFLYFCPCEGQGGKIHYGQSVRRTHGVSDSHGLKPEALRRLPLVRRLLSPWTFQVLSKRPEGTGCQRREGQEPFRVTRRNNNVR